MVASAISFEPSWSALHTQVRALLDTASPQCDWFVAVQRRFGGVSPPLCWEPVLVEGDPDLGDFLDRLCLPPLVSALGVVTWATARYLGPDGIEEVPAWVGLVTQRRGPSLSATITVDAGVLWTPYPSGPLALACKAALTASLRSRNE